MAVMPLSAAATVWMAFDTESSSWLKSLARLLRPDAVKKLVGLSSAELTRSPVASRSWDLLRSSAVPCKFNRFDRTALESVMSDMCGPPRPEYLSFVNLGKKRWLIFG